MKAEIVVRNKRAKRSKAGFAGPGVYIAVVTREDTAEPVGNHPLSAANIRKYGWNVRIMGEGYHNHRGPNSKFGRTMAKALEVKRENESLTSHP